MDATRWILIGLAASLAAYVIALVGLLAIGRRSDARAMARFVPDCVVLFGGLLRDPRVSRASKALLGVAVVYLLLPFDLVPDFIPVAGQLDDAIVVALALRIMLRSCDAELLREHWPGPAASLDVVRRLARPQRPTPPGST
jgi:uncharacterized membrane protein YkvA (DUF1232 family)